MKLTPLLETIEKTISISDYETLTGRTASQSMINRFVAILNYHSHNPIVLGANYDSTRAARSHIKRVIHKNQPMFNLNEVTYFRLIANAETVDEINESDDNEISQHKTERFYEKCYEKFSDDLTAILKASANIVDVYQTAEYETMNTSKKAEYKKIVELLNQLDEMNAETQFKYRELLQILENI